MSLARVHNFSISLDGFATGEGQTRDAPFGHAGERLHEWMFATRWWQEMVGKPGGCATMALQVRPYLRPTPWRAGRAAAPHRDRAARASGSRHRR